MALVVAGCSSSGSSVGGSEQIVRELDSLAAASSGDYVHFRIGSCAGYCDAVASIYRTSTAKHYIYDGEAWKYDDLDRDFILYRLRRPITVTDANNLFGALEQAGVFSLGQFASDLKSQTPAGAAPVWIRARIGGRELKLDNVYMFGADAPVVGPPAPGLSQMRTLLLGPLYPGIR